MKTIVLKTCQTSFEANLLKSGLENNGITCFLSNELTATLLPHHFIGPDSGIQIFIDENDHDKAIKVIKEAGSQNSLAICCPQCGSENVSITLGKNKLKKVFLIFVSLFAGTFKNNYFIHSFLQYLQNRVSVSVPPIGRIVKFKDTVVNILYSC